MNIPKIVNLALLIAFPIAWFAPLMRAGILPLFGLSEISVISGLQSLWGSDVILEDPYPAPRQQLQQQHYPVRDEWDRRFDVRQRQQQQLQTNNNVIYYNKKQQKKKKKKGSSLFNLEMFNRIFIFPGTKWCGRGDVAEHWDDLGYHSDVDKCCR